ncbi:15958_t:CDS:2 [Entrophospora sp. SA101]|nr:15958_t:CDS:2 [Entrophospora sp. SA101]
MNSDKDKKQPSKKLSDSFIVIDNEGEDNDTILKDDGDELVKSFLNNEKQTGPNPTNSNPNQSTFEDDHDGGITTADTTTTAINLNPSEKHEFKEPSSLASSSSFTNAPQTSSSLLEEIDNELKYNNRHNMLNTKNDNNRDTKYNDTSKLFDDQTGNPISNKRLLTEHNKVSSSSPNKQIKKGKEIEGATFANENNTPPPVPPKTNIGSSSNQDVYDPFADAPPSITAQQIIDSLLPKTTRGSSSNKDDNDPSADPPPSLTAQQIIDSFLPKTTIGSSSNNPFEDTNTPYSPPVQQKFGSLENNDIYNTAAAATDNLSPSSSNKKTEYNFQFSDPPINDYKHLFPGSPSADDFTKRNNETNRYPLGHTTRTSNEFKHLFPDDSSTDETNKYPSSESPYSSLGHTTKPSSDLFSDFPSADDSTKRNNETDKHPLGHTTRTSNELKRLFPDDSSTDDPTKKKVETNRDSFSKPQNKNSSKNKSSNRHSTQLPSSSTFAGDNNQFSFSDIDGLADNNSAENSNDEEDNNSEEYPHVKKQQPKLS